MHRVIVWLCTALAVLSCTTGLRAQEIDEAPVYDPPDTEYYEGALPTDQAIERKLPPAPRYRAVLPASVDLSARMPRPGSQGNLPSCTAWAIAYAARSYYTGTLEGRDLHSAANLPSPNFIYHLARNGDCPGGSAPGPTVEVLKRGALSLAEHPYSEACVPPASQQLVSRAHDFRVRGLRRVDYSRIDNVKAALASSNPVIFRFADSKAFMRHRGPGVFAESIQSAEKRGYHYMVFVGYDDARQALRVINSWGPGWGDRGYGWIGYDLLKTRVDFVYVLDVATGPVARPTPARPMPTAGPYTPQPVPPSLAPSRPTPTAGPPPVRSGPYPVQSGQPPSPRR